MTGIFLSKEEEIRFKDFVNTMTPVYSEYMSEPEIKKRIKKELHSFCSDSVFST
jgi:hypothetical protein